MSQENLTSSIRGKIIPAILLANLPPLIFSFMNLNYNTLFTCMLPTKEWRGFAHKRQTLQVSSPLNQQRSTYWLQLPYTYSVPPMLASSIFQWLVSLSFFLVRIAMISDRDTSLGSGGDDNVVAVTENVTMTCGHSIIAIITGMIFGATLNIMVLLNRCKADMPLAAYSSAAISAA